MEWIFIIMIAAGVFGGIVNYFLNDDSFEKPKDNDADNIKFKIWYKLLKCISLGIAGSLTIPLFIRISNQQTGFFDTYSFEKNLAFMGLCLIASIFSKRFLVTISDNVLKLAKEAKENSVEAKEESLQAKAKVNKVEAKIEESKNEVTEDVDERFALLEGIGKESGIIKSALDFNKTEISNLPQKGARVNNDQQKNQWGGLSERNCRRITGSVTATDHDKGYYKIILKVESTDIDKPLTGMVIFHLHETFKNDKRIVYVKDGIAKLILYAYGAFTVGVECDNGKTWLELDLSELENAPKKFRES